MFKRRTALLMFSDCNDAAINECMHSRCRRMHTQGQPIKRHRAAAVEEEDDDMRCRQREKTVREGRTKLVHPQLKDNKKKQ